MIGEGTYSVVVVRALIAGLNARGVDGGALAAAVGITPELLVDTDGRVPLDIVTAFFDKAALIAADPDFGLHAGASLPLGALEVLDHATRTSRTIADALGRTIQYYALIASPAALELESMGKLARLVRKVPPTIGVSRQATEMLFAVIVTRSELITGKRWPLESVSFAHPRPAKTSEHARIFHCPVHFDRPETDLTFDASWLQTPVRTADPAVASTLDRFAETLIAKLRHEDADSDSLEGSNRSSSFMGPLRRAIAESLRDGATLEEAARGMRMSARTLQRRLGELGTTHSDLVDEVRQELATRYLANPSLGIGEVGYLLGFSDPSAFYRAFRRWKDQTPSEYRAGLAR